MAAVRFQHSDRILPAGGSAHGRGLKGPTGGEHGNRVRALYDLVRAKMAAKGGIVDEGDVQEVCRAIDGIPLEELGIEPTSAQAYRFGAGPVSRALHARLSQLQASAGAGAITYLHIHEDELMTIGIFQLPEGARIPLHNHPGMTVFSRLLFGSLHIRAYDWAEGSGSSGHGGGDDGVDGQLGRQPHHLAGHGCDHDDEDDFGHGQGASSQLQQQQDLKRQPHRQPRGQRGVGHAHTHKRPSPGPLEEDHHQQQHQQQHMESHDSSDSSSTSSAASCSSTLGGARVARLVADRVLTAPTPTSVLFPADGGNIHSFTALSPCAVLDVLTPPYAPACGRDCTYYREVFPPQLMDGRGRPLLVPAEEVAAWVRWQQAQPAARRGPSADGWQAGGGRRSCDGDGDSVLEDAPMTPTEAGGPRHPWHSCGTAAQGMLLGLEAVSMPSDFVVGRGVYRGRGIHS